VQTLEHKAAPMIGLIVSDMLHNQDFYGDQIRNAGRSARRAGEAGSVVSREAVRAARRPQRAGSGEARADPRMKVAGFVGVTAAPRDATRTPAENKMMEYLAREGAARRRPRRSGRERAGERTQRDVWLERFQRLNADEALAVYTLASAAERAQWRDALELKLIKAGREDELDALEPVHVSTTSSTTSSTASTESRATSRPPPRVRVPR
jgi:hypothetical protein